MDMAECFMKTILKPSYLISFYFFVLLTLLLCVITTPLLIQNGISITARFVIDEEILETAMILVLFGISFLLLIRIMNRLKKYRKEMDSAVHEKSKLVSRLADAFSYIGKVNVEIQEIESTLCGVSCYPQSKNEFRALVDNLALKAMTIAVTPWLVVRMIERHSGRTVSEHAVSHPRQTLPTVTVGNRAILDGIQSDELQTIGPRQKNLDLLTVFIFPRAEISKEKSVLLTAILNQIEMLFILYRAGWIKPKSGAKNTEM